MSVPTWLPDGLYVLQRGIDMTLGPEKTLHCPAYNDSEFDFVLTTPTTETEEDFIQNDVEKCLVAHYFDGVDIFGYRFTWLYDHEGSTIDSITVRSFVSGKGRNVVQVNGTNYYGELTTDCHVAAWVETTWTTNPATGQPWTHDALFSDGAFVYAGIDLRALADQTYPSIAGSEGVPMPDHPDDPRIYINGSKLYTQEVTVRWGGASEETYYAYITISTEMADCGEFSIRALSRRWENQIGNGSPFSPSFWLAENHEIPADPDLVEDPFELSVELGAYATAFAKAGVSYHAYSLSWTPFAFFSIPFLKIGGVKYYSDYYRVGCQTATVATVAGQYAANQVTYSKFLTSSPGRIHFLRIYASGSGNVKVAIYSDSSGSPSSRLYTATAAVVAGWNDIEIGPLDVTQNTYYWLAFNSDSAIISYASSGGTEKHKSATYSSYAFPSTADSGLSSGTTLTLICCPIYLSSDVNVDARYTVNPVTGAAWSAGDLDGEEYGIECRRDTSTYPLTGSYAGNPYLNATYRTIAAVDSLWLILYNASNNWLQQVTGGHTNASRHTWRWVANNPQWYPYHGSNFVNLSGDMYYHESDASEPTRPLYFSQKDDLYKRYASDFCELPPSFSQVNGVTVAATIYGWTDAPDAYWRIFVWIAGTYYYSDSYSIFEGVQEFAWVNSPATGAAWTYDELQGARFGAEVNRVEKHDTVHFRLAYLDADIDYQEIAGPLQPTFVKVNIFEESVSHQKESQSPNLKAQELRFVLPAGGYLPERTEIAWVKDGALAFRGIVWRLVEHQSREVQVLAKSQQIILAYRHLPGFFYHARNTRFSSVYTLEDMFSDACPTYPCHQYWTMYDFPDAYLYRHWDDDSLMICGFIPLCQGVQLIEATETNLGIFFLLNSLMPYGSGTTRLSGVAPVARNRMKFLTNHDPSTVPYNRYNIDGGNMYYSGGGSICLPDDVGSVRRFREGSGTLAVDEYEEDGEDLLIGVNEGAYMVLFDHAYETFLRPGANDLSAKFLAVPYYFDGSFESTFSDFFQRMGQEIRFRNEWDGNIYMDAATEFAKDTHKKFVNGRRNCTVTKAQRDIRPNAVLGVGSIPLISTNWAPARTWLTEVLQVGDRDGQDLREWLDLKADDDDPIITIKALQPEWLLDDGDLIYAQADGYGLESVRVRKIVNQTNGCTITAGKRLIALSDKWGMWRNATGSKDTDHPIKNQEIAIEGPTGSQTFVVLAEDYLQGAWKCKVAVNWSLWTAGEGINVAAPAFMVLIVSLNGIVIPSGRLSAQGNSGGYEIDITDLCNVSTSSDTTNTISATLVNGLTVNASRGHKISGSIKQYRRLEAVLNA